MASLWTQAVISGTTAATTVTRSRAMVAKTSSTEVPVLSTMVPPW